MRQGALLIVRDSQDQDFHTSFLSSQSLTKQRHRIQVRKGLVSSSQGHFVSLQDGEIACESEYHPLSALDVKSPPSRPLLRPKRQVVKDSFAELDCGSHQRQPTLRKGLLLTSSLGISPGSVIKDSQASGNQEASSGNSGVRPNRVEAKPSVQVYNFLPQTSPASIESLSLSPILKVRSWLSQDYSASMTKLSYSPDSTIPMPPTDRPTSRDSRLTSTAQHDLQKRILASRSRRIQASKHGIECIIPLRLTAIQRKLYLSLLSKNAGLIEASCQSSPTAESLASLDKLINSLRQISVHPLCSAETLPDTQMSESDEAWYLISTSSKFELIADILEALRSTPVRIGIFTENRRMEELWLKVLKGLQIRCIENHAPDMLPDSTEDTSPEDLEVILMPQDTSDHPKTFIDLAFTLNGQGRLQNTTTLNLVVNNSVEHVSRDIPDTVTLVSTIAFLGASVGICTSDTVDSARQLVRFLSDEEPIECGTLSNVVFSSSQYESLSYTASANDLGSSGVRDIEESAASTEKLPQILVSEIDGIQVHTEAPVIMADETFASHRNGSVLHAQPVFTTEDMDFGMSMPTIVSQTQEPESQYISPIHLEKTPTQIYEAARNGIWLNTTEDEERIAILESDVERMMLRFDDLREECRNLAEERDTALAQAASLQKRFERVLEESRSARQEKNDLKLELDQLKKPALPDESSPEYYKIENMRLKTELEKSKRSGDSRAQDFEFLRQQYHQSSSAAAELAGENETLKSDLTLAKNQIQGGLGYRLAIHHMESTQKALKDEANNLGSRNNILIEQLRRMRDEKLAARGRGDGRRDIGNQDKKRAASASADAGHRKKVEKMVHSRLSVASLISSETEAEASGIVPRTSGSRVMLQPMQRVQSHDAGSNHRDKPPRRTRTPF